MLIFKEGFVPLASKGFPSFRRLVVVVHCLAHLPKHLIDVHCGGASDECCTWRSGDQAFIRDMLSYCHGDWTMARACVDWIIQKFL